MFLDSVRQVAATGDFKAAERMYFLTLMPSNRFHAAGQTLRHRALLETVLEAVRLPRHAQMIQGLFVRGGRSVRVT